MNYMTTQEASEKWGISLRRIQVYCTEGRIAGAKQVGRQWMIPVSAQRPLDGRTKQAQHRPVQEHYHFPFLMYSESYVSRQDLQEEEQQLLQAQIMTLHGNFTESIACCRSLLSVKVSPAVRFGVYASIAYNCIPLGLYTEYTDCLARLEQLRQQDTAHDEDYRLLLAFLRFQANFNASELRSIRPEKLSPDAVIPYTGFIMQALVIKGEKESADALRVYSAFCKHLEDLGMLPNALFLHGILAALYRRAGDAEAQDAHIAEACRIGCEQGFLQLLSKCSSIAPAEFQAVLSAMDPPLANKLVSHRAQRKRSWCGLYCRVQNIPLVPNYSAEEAELLLLLSQNLSVRDIAVCKRLSPGEVRSRIKALCAQFGYRSKSELADYGRQVFTPPALPSPE